MTRCKFICNSKREYKTGDIVAFDYAFSAVYGDSPDNKEFWHYTPAGQLNVSVVKDGTFEVGKSYFLDIHEAV